jgi:hypothetical protein
MRSSYLVCLLLTLGGISAAQDTNFPAGPQYLITTASPLLLHSIATPSLSLGQALPSLSSVTQAEVAPVPAPSAISPSGTFLGGVYWGEHKSSEIIGRRLETPSMTASETALYMEAVANALRPVPVAIPVPATEVPARFSLIELSTAQPPANLPPALFDAGVTGTADAESLRSRGYGVPLGDTAAFWKAHKGHASHTYTNSDIQRLHGG